MDMNNLLDMDALKGQLEDFDLQNFLPKLDSVWGTVELLLRLFVLAGPVILLGLGLWYLLLPPKEANHRAGFRTLWGMGSVEAWRFTQKAAGIAFGALGLILTVVMLLITLGFGKLEPEAMIQSAACCILWEIGLVLLATVVLHILAIILFDWKGVRRSKKKKQH